MQRARSAKQQTLALFDWTGARWLLAKLATRYARWLTRADVEIFYDELWIHRVGAHFFPDGPRFTYFRDELQRWPDQAHRYIADADEYWLRFGLPGPGEVVIDVGAGRGEDVLAFSRAVGPTGRVIAIEAHPLTFRLLTRFRDLNRLNNVTLVHAAAMDSRGFVSIVDAEHWDANAVANQDGENTTRVTAAPLDDICEANGIRSIALVKMNIEGAEREALPGMERMLASVQTVCVACHDFRADRGDGEHFRTRAFVEQFLAAHGFEVRSRRDDPRDWVRDHVFGIRPSPGSA